MLSNGSRIGAYEILGSLGAGGMGEVYRARDTRLGRDVAIKMLLPTVAADPDRLARFSREAQVLASLNHPHIAHVYGIEDAGDTHALIMELVEGSTLADRIADGPIPIREALSIASQIADALAAAHEQGIIHRDLKPANIKVRGDATVKVLDFGLAKAAGTTRGSAAESNNPANSPTLTAATQVGVILGTAAYMSPEQAAGKPVDHRTDLWAFGVVLLEMLTGRPTFAGETVSHVIASVLKSEPDWSALPADTPATLRKLLRRCLEKDRKRRIDSAADARLELEDLLTAPPSEAELNAPRRTAPTLLAAALLVAAFAGAAASWMFLSRASAPPADPSRFVIAPDSTQAIRLSPFERSLAISPDGRLIAYTTPGIGTTGGLIIVRPLDRLEAEPVAGVTNARQPTFSPDGRWMAFVEDTLLRKIAVSGGEAVTLCQISGGPRGISWGDDNTIVFATSDPTTGLWRVSADGGEPKALTALGANQPPEDHLFPSILPGGRGVLFTIAAPGRSENSKVAVLDSKTGEHKTLVRVGTQPEYLATGHLVYAAAGALQVAAFDLDTLEVRGNPIPAIEQPAIVPTGAAYYVVSPSGTLVYVPASTTTQRKRSVAWVNRQGGIESIDAPPRVYTSIRLAPDGRRLALEARDEESDVWTWEFARATMRKLTYGPAIDNHAVWTPDSGQIVFASDRDGPMNLYRVAVEGVGTIERLTVSATPHFATSMGRDAGALFGVIDGPTFFDVGKFEIMSATPPGPTSTSPLQALVQTKAIEHNAEISPNGRYLAYASNESGRFEVHVRPYPRVESDRWIVSIAGGLYPSWAKNGRELFYVDSAGSLMALTVDTSATTFGWGKPAPLFKNRFDVNPVDRPYDADEHAQRFAVLTPTPGDAASATASLVVVLNWSEELRRKLN